MMDELNIVEIQCVIDDKELYNHYACTCVFQEIAILREVVEAAKEYCREKDMPVKDPIMIKNTYDRLQQALAKLRERK